MIVEHLKLLHRYHYWKRARCIFIHIPKAAGTSINHALYKRTLGHYSIEEISNRFPKLVNSVYTFSFCRNPFDRLISAYQFVKAGRTKHMGIQNPAQYNIPEFKTFDRFVCEWLSQRNPDSLDFVFRPQSLFVCIDDQIKVDFVGKVEDMATDIVEVENSLGRKLEIKKLNRTNKKRLSVSSESLNIIAKLYQKDFKLFGYDPSQF